MDWYLPAAFIALGSPMAPAASSPQPGNLTEELFYASNWASGRKFCDRQWAATLERRFNARFGQRLKALREIHQRHFGKDPEFIFTTDCVVPGRGYSQDDAMAKFAAKLRELERKYGGY